MFRLLVSGHVLGTDVEVIVQLNCSSSLEVQQRGAGFRPRRRC
jgi:hypothetical protein